MRVLLEMSYRFQRHLIDTLLVFSQKMMAYKLNLAL